MFRRFSGIVKIAMLVMLICAISMTSASANTELSKTKKFSIKNSAGTVVSVWANMVSDPGSGECWAYANSVYSNIWGKNFASDFTGTNSAGYNSLRDLATADRKMTAANAKKFISAAPLGAVIRITSCTESCSNFKHDGCKTHGYGHNLIIVEKSSSGFTALHRGGSRQCTQYTWSSFVSAWSSHKYFKYIKYPGAMSITWQVTPMSGTYEFNKDDASRHDCYENSPLVNNYSKGDRVEVIGSIVNGGGNTWYQIADGSFVYNTDVDLVTCDHLRYCNESYCGLCGVYYSGDNYIHPGMTYVYDNDSHTEVCTGCGHVWGTYVHQRRCHQDYCLTCYAYYTGVNYQHPDGLYLYTDDTMHYEGCSYCGYSSNSEHWRLCNEYTCVYCYADYFGNLVQHADLLYLGYVDGHVELCATCGYTSEKYDHWRSCITYSCSSCGIEYYGNNVYHGDSTWYRDDVAHTLYCADCNGYYDDGYHLRYCDETWCAYCYYSYTGDNVYHTGTQIVDHGFDATCTLNGWTDGSHCSVCNMTIVPQEAIDAKGHTEVKDEAIAATCTTDGKTEGRHCSVCGTTIAAQTTIPATGHDGGKWVVVTEATATQDGRKELRCTICNYVLKSESIPKLNNGNDDIPDPVVQTVNAKKGDSVTLNVYVSSNDVYMIKLRLKYDRSVLELVNSTCNGGQANAEIFSLYSVTNECINGMIGTVTFKIKETVVDGTYTISADVDEVYDSDMNPTSCKPAVDKVKVASRLPGDVNGDGSVDGRDLLLLARYNAEFPVTINSSNADVDANGTVDGRDLLILARYNAEFPGVYLK